MEVLDYAGKLNDEQRDCQKNHADIDLEELRANLQWLFDCGEASWNETPGYVGGYGGFLKSFIDGEFENVMYSPSLLERLREFVDQRLNPNAPRINPLFVENSVWIKVEGAVRYCQQNQGIIFIIGASGIGKSESLLQIKRLDRSVIFVTANRAVRAWGVFLELLSKKLPGLYRSGNNASFLQGMIKYFRGNHNTLLIVDEAHHLSWDAFEIVRTLHDESGIGVVFAGQQSMVDVMKRGRQSYLWDQIFSRADFRLSLSGKVTLKDVEMITQKIFSDGIDKRSLEFLYHKALGSGKFRALIKLCRRAQCIAQAEGKKITLELLQAVSQILMT